MNKEILVKYLNSSCTKKEFEQFREWINIESAGGEHKKMISDDWNSFQPDLRNFDSSKYHSLLDKIHHEINLNNRNHNQKLIYKIGKWVGRAAAILLIPMLGTFFYMLSNNDYQIQKFADATVDSLEIIAPIGSRAVVQLSDGTEVNLNYGSKIKYPRNFTGDTREIVLEGEGYFDVAHNPDKPFIVKAGKLNIVALGTVFNVQAYPGDDVISTTLVEGKVAIERTFSGGKSERIGTMIPDQHVTYNLISDKVFSTKENVEKYVAWKNGKLVFDNEPITGIADKLSRMFNVEIEIADNAKDFTYTVTFVNDPLFLILDLMKESTPITYKVFPRKKLSDGTYTKQKIRIEKRI